MPARAGEGFHECPQNAAFLLHVCTSHSLSPTVPAVPRTPNKTTGMSFSRRSIFTTGEFKQCQPPPLEQRPAAREVSCGKGGCLPPEEQRQGNPHSSGVVFFFFFMGNIYDLSRTGQMKQLHTNVACLVCRILLLCLFLAWGRCCQQNGHLRAAAR